eukprot:TRINITY_DN42577_c0_g1_i1.p4 TRINITY_DN42577_c0_g1~~TRINITY_DN42577_c0_g1_i1.p4  ORF type:complete len:128 (-),score=10.40 TRINITY_DN42577_c0_g1_i1:349-732(-)
MQGEFYKGERVYQIIFTQLFKNMKKNYSILKQFISRMASTLQLFTEKQIVHSDLKPENILLTSDEEQANIIDLKIIDFGSILFLGGKWNISTATPEYMPPEVLELLINRSTIPAEQQQELIEQMSNP